MPTVEQHPGEGTDKGVRQQQDGERCGDAHGIWFTLGREQHKRRERGLQQSVTELTGESDAVEAAEIVARKNRPKGAVSRVRGVLNSHGERLRVP